MPDNTTWEVNQFKVDDLVIFDYFRGNKNDPMVGRITKICETDRTVWLEALSIKKGYYINIGMEKLRMNQLSLNSLANGNGVCS